MTDVAKRAGVSTSTVSHILNKTRYVSPEITQRVNQAIQELDYRQNMLARAMRQGKTNIIGVILPNTAYTYMYSVALGAIEQCLRAQGYTMILQVSRDDPEAEKAAIQHLLDWNVDGMIINPADNDFDYSLIPCPVVLMDRAPHKQTVNSFFVENYSITCQMMQRFLDAGHTKIALMSAPIQYSPTTLRLAGYRDGLSAAGLSLRDDYILTADPTVANGEALAHTLIEKTDATAVLITSSRLTVGAMNYFQANQISIPQRMAIISFGNYEWMHLCNPPLDCVIQPNREIGERAADRILNLLKDTNDTNIVIEWVPCTYKAGKSV